MDMNKNVTLVEVSFCILGGLLISLIFWQKFDAKIFAVIAILIGLVEFLAQIKWRLAVVCTKCGFDPILYLKDKNKTALKIKNFLAKRKADPAILLSKNPHVDLPVLIKTPGEKRQIVESKGKKLDLSL